VHAGCTISLASIERKFFLSTGSDTKILQSSIVTARTDRLITEQAIIVIFISTTDFLTPSLPPGVVGSSWHIWPQGAYGPRWWQGCCCVRVHDMRSYLHKCQLITRIANKVISNVPCKVWKSAVPPDHLRCVISFSHLQHSNTLEKCEGQKLFELNVYFVRILIRFCTYSDNSQSS